MYHLKQIYLDLIADYDPFTDISEHTNLTCGQMLYNLIEIKKNNFDFIDLDTMKLYDRFTTLIYLFESLGFKPSL